ncbi:MAG: hypothetical protein ACRDKS_10890 [Actinomycetota bacterium]
MRRKGSIAIAFVTLIAVLAMLTPASAAPALIIAGPGSAASTYDTPFVVQQKGKAVTFYNFDIAQHDVRSTSGKFFTGLIGLGKHAKLVGAKALAKGTYTFFCSIHPNMKGKLRII